MTDETGLQQQTMNSTVELGLNDHPEDRAFALVINAKPAEDEQIIVQEKILPSDHAAYSFEQEQIVDESVRQGSVLVVLAVNIPEGTATELERYRITEDGELSEDDAYWPGNKP